MDPDAAAVGVATCFRRIYEGDLQKLQCKSSKVEGAQCSGNNSNIKQEEKQKQNTEETVEIYLPSLQIAKLWEVTVNVYEDMFRDKPIKIRD